MPIRDASGRMVAAIHASVLSKRASKAHERKLLAAAKLCAEQVQRQMGNLGEAKSA